MPQNESLWTEQGKKGVILHDHEEFELMYFMTFHDDPKVGASNSVPEGPEPCRV